MQPGAESTMSDCSLSPRFPMVMISGLSSSRSNPPCDVFQLGWDSRVCAAGCFGCALRSHSCHSYTPVLTVGIRQLYSLNIWKPEMLSKTVLGSLDPPRDAAVLLPAPCGHQVVNEVPAPTTVLPSVPPAIGQDPGELP